MNFLNQLSVATRNQDSSGISRRTFLQATGVGGSLIIGASMAAGSLPAFGATQHLPNANTAPAFNAFLKITPDSRVIIVVKHLDMGQGVTTGLTSLVAEELDASWDQIDWEFAPADASRYNNLFWGNSQGTGGSSSIANSWMQLRQAGAAARAMLVAAAAAQWKVPAEEIRVSKGVISHGNNSTSFGALVSKAALLSAPQQPKLTDPKDFQFIGPN